MGRDFNTPGLDLEMVLAGVVGHRVDTVVAAAEAMGDRAEAQAVVRAVAHTVHWSILWTGGQQVELAMMDGVQVRLRLDRVEMGVEHFGFALADSCSSTVASAPTAEMVNGPGIREAVVRAAASGLMLLN
jgi:hypothetical protein